VLYGDTPLLKKETVAKLLIIFIRENSLDATLLTLRWINLKVYGRILRDKCANLEANN